MELSVEQSFPPASALRSVTADVKWRYTRRQWASLLLLAIGNLGLAICSGLQAPFFPREAEMKGATPSQYGLVFGLFYLTNFMFSPLFGRIMPAVGPDFLRDMGMFVVGVCFILFGFLDQSPPGATFLALAYVVRIVEGIGSAAYKTSNFAIVAATFPDNMASSMGFLETMFGIGLIIGPTVGGVLYQVGGYSLPFVSSGCVLVAISLLTMVALTKTEVQPRQGKKMNSLTFLLDPFVILYSWTLTLGATMLGYNQATLEPHLRQFNLTAVGVGAVFVLGGGFYGVSSTVWGYLADRCSNPTVLTTVACIFMGICYTLIGPAPILPFDPHLWLVGVALVFVGCGYGATRVVAFVDCLQHGIASGYENNMATYGMISGIFNASFGMGFFIGPTVGGVCMQYFGYPRSSFFLAILAYATVLCFIFHICCGKRRTRKSGTAESDSLLERNAQTFSNSNLISNGHAERPAETVY